MCGHRSQLSAAPGISAREQYQIFFFLAAPHPTQVTRPQDDGFRRSSSVDVQCLRQSSCTACSLLSGQISSRLGLSLFSEALGSGGEREESPFASFVMSKRAPVPLQGQWGVGAAPARGLIRHHAENLQSSSCFGFHLLTMKTVVSLCDMPNKHASGVCVRVRVSV